MRHPDPPASVRWFRLVLLVVAVAPALLLLVAGVERRWMDDDGFINLRVVRNLLEGYGPVFNLDERVEAVTSPLWILVLTALGAVGVRLEYAAVFAAIALSAAGVVLAQDGASRLHGAGVGLVERLGRGSVFFVPLGAAIYVALPPAWDYASSGLETGLALAWLGASFRILAMTVCPPAGAAASRSRVCACVQAALVGLGPLIRPELTLYALAPLGVLAWDASVRAGPKRLSRTVAVWAIGLSAGAAPGAYEIFRMGFYGSVVPNTAIAKEAFLTRYEQGRCYFENFFGTYDLAWPLLAAVIVWAVLLRARWPGLALRRASRRVPRDASGDASPGEPRITRSWGAFVGTAAPPIAAIVHVAYIVRLGGDYMHARMFIPPVFAALLPLAMVPATASPRPSGYLTKALVGAAGAVIVAWLPICGGTLRVGVENVCGIGDERGWYARLAKVTQPVVLDSYRRHSFYDEAMTGLARAEADCPSLAAPGGPQRDPSCRRLHLDDADQKELAPTAASFPLADDVDPRIHAVLSRGAIGMAGYLYPANVHVVDRLGLANPLVAHVELTERGRPGHEKTLGSAWMVARFGAPEAVEDASVTAARNALRCGALADIERAARGPLTFRAFLDNMTHAWHSTNVRIPPDPFEAEAKFCGAALPPDVSAGGAGGKKFRWDCPGGLTVSSLAGVFDAEQGAMASLRSACGVRDQEQQTDARVIGPKFGEGDPAQFELACPGDSVAVGIRGRSDSLVRSVALLCSIADDAASTPEAGTESGTPFSLRCPASTTLRGIQGRSGALVDAIGIVCER